MEEVPSILEGGGRMGVGRFKPSVTLTIMWIAWFGEDEDELNFG
jgi:hypothetical protein